MVKRKVFIILIIFVCAFIPEVYAEMDYSSQNRDFYQPTMSNDVRTQSAFQSTSYYNGSYTVPFAADNIEIGSTNPYASSSPTGRRNAPPSIPGGTDNKPTMPTIPLGDGVWFLLACALIFVARKKLIRKQA